MQQQQVPSGGVGVVGESVVVMVVRQGGLEKRSAGLLQVWKRKHCTLTEEAVLLHAPRHAHGKPKELHFSRVRTVDCVERKGGHAYFTMVMADGREIDFRCRAEERWSAEITLQLVQYKNRQAVLAVRSTRHKQQRLGTGAGESDSDTTKSYAMKDSQEAATQRLQPPLLTCAAARRNTGRCFFCTASPPSPPRNPNA